MANRAVLFYFFTVLLAISYGEQSVVVIIFFLINTSAFPLTKDLLTASFVFKKRTENPLLKRHGQQHIHKI